MVHERRRWSPQGKISRTMACMIVKMVGSAMARKLPTPVGQLGQQVGIGCLTCPELSLNVLIFDALLVLFLAKVPIHRLVHSPFHVVDAPVPCYFANLFVFRFVVLWWQPIPFFILLLKALVCVILAVLADVLCIITCIGFLFSLVLSLMSILVELVGQLGRKLKVLVLLGLGFKGHDFLLIRRLGLTFHCS